MEKSIPIGSIIVLPGGGEAVLKYAGPVQNKGGIFAGVELIGEMMGKGKNSGEFEGVQYFKTTSPNTGLFLPYSRVLSLNQHRAIHQSRVGSSLSQHQKSPAPSGRSPLAISNRSTPIQSQFSANATNENAKDSGEVILLQRKFNQVKQDHQDTLKKVQMYEVQLREKNEILNHLETTIKEHFEPALLHNEKQMNLKDAKFKKYKENTEVQLKELVDAVEALDQQAKENEILYMNKVKDLETRIAEYELKQSESGNLSGQIANEQNASKLSILEEKLMEKEFLVDQLKTSSDRELASLREILEKVEKERDSLMESQSAKENGANGREIVLSEQIQSLKAENVSLQQTVKELQSYKSNVLELQQQIGEGELRASEYSSQIETLKKEKDDLNARLESESGLINELKKRQTEFDSELKYFRSQTQTLAEENSKYTDQITVLNAELTGYKSQLAELDSSKNSIIEELKNRNLWLENELQSLKNNKESSTATVSSNSLVHSSHIPQPTMGGYQSISPDLVDVFNELPIYSPTQVADAAAGRAKWCGLCERDGHDSTECPYENDMF